MTIDRAEPVLDTSPLAGLKYECLPGCGLCCYAEPLVVPAEQRSLLQIVPEAEFRSRGGFEFLRSYPDGGACQLLAGQRCTAHPVRPGPCREFPLFGYVGTRLQAVAVLSCPGVDLAFLERYGGPATADPPQGLDPELSALRSRISYRVNRRLEASRRRRRRICRDLEIDGRWVDESEVRRQLQSRLLLPEDGDFPPPSPPSRGDGLDLLPLVFDGRAGPLAFAAGSGGWELLELRPRGGVATSLGVALPPDRLPPLSDEARRVLSGYLRYWLERDQLFGVVHLGMTEDSGGDVTDCVAGELRRIGALAVSRAYVLARLSRGTDGPISRTDLHQGIRATDQDLLDREGWGTRL